jgi:hypothetical protein
LKINGFRKEKMNLKKYIFLFIPLLLWKNLLFCGEKKFEIEFFGNMFFPKFERTYSYTYSPPFSPGAYLSSSELSLNYMAKTKNGYGFGMNYFPKKNLGLRMELNYFRASLEGESSEYSFYLQYVSMQPPSYTPRLYSLKGSIDWETPEGDVTRLNTNIGLVYRVNIWHRISADFLMGFNYEISKLDLKSIGYTEFWLGGHSVLFSETYKIEISSGNIKDFGLSGGGSLNLPLTNNFDFSLGFKYFYFPVRFASVELKGQTNEEETIGDLKTDELEIIKSKMKLPLIEFPHSYLSLTASLKFRF